MDGEAYIKLCIDLAIESWRFSNVFKSILSKLQPEDFTRYQGRYIWFRKKLDEILDVAQIKIITFPQGTAYDIGMAVTPINLEDFEADAQLEIEQMIEPVIMEGTTAIRYGKVILRRAAK